MDGGATFSPRISPNFPYSSFVSTLEYSHSNPGSPSSAARCADKSWSGSASRARSQDKSRKPTDHDGQGHGDVDTEEIGRASPAYVS